MRGFHALLSLSLTLARAARFRDRTPTATPPVRDHQGFHVCFSDFNREVIEQVTVPNVRLNVEERYWDLAEYYSGDWSSLSPLLDKVRRNSPTRERCGKEARSFRSIALLFVQPLLSAKTPSEKSRRGACAELSKCAARRDDGWL